MNYYIYNVTNYYERSVYNNYYVVSLCYSLMLVL